MGKLKFLVLFGVVAVGFAISPPRANAQVAVQIGPAPVCPYGYFDYPPYECAPYGYYGPEWFANGIFMAPARGITDRLASGDTLIIASIAMTDSMATIRGTESSGIGERGAMSKVSTATRCVMAMAIPIWALPTNTADIRANLNEDPEVCS